MSQVPAPSDKTNPIPWKADLALVLATLFWGSTFVVVKDALADTSTLVFLFLRFALATVAAAIWFRCWRWPKASRAEWAAGLIAGSCLFASYWFQVQGLVDTTASKSAFLTGLNVVIVPVMLAVRHLRWPAPLQVIGSAVATAGMALMTLEGPLTAVNRGDLLSIGSAFAFSVHIILTSHFAPKVLMPRFLTTQFAVVAALGAATFWWAEPARLHPTMALAGAVVMTATLPTVASFALMTWSQQITPATRAALFFTLEPLFAWVTGFVVAGEILSRQATWGALLILLGVLATEIAPIFRKKPISRTTGEARPESLY